MAILNTVPPQSRQNGGVSDHPPPKSIRAGADTVRQEASAARWLPLARTETGKTAECRTTRRQNRSAPEPIPSGRRLVPHAGCRWHERRQACVRSEERRVGK